MFTLSKRTVGLLLIATLLISLIPAMGTSTQAATTYGLHLNAPFDFDEDVDLEDQVSLTPGNPFETNQSSITISGFVEQIETNTISFRVRKYGTNQVRDEQITPAVSGKNFSFDNVMLFPELNEIEIYYETGVGSTAQETRYVYFHNAPSISGLEVIAAPNVRVEDFSLPPYDAGNFPNSQSIFNRVIKLAPSPFNMNPPIVFQGEASNADEVLLGSQPAGIFGSRFIVDTGQLGVVKGDYYLDFIVRNESASVNYPYHVAFNNGEPVLLDIHANMEAGAVKLDQLSETYLSGDFVSANDTDFTFSGYLYIEDGVEFDHMVVNLQYVADAATTQASITIDQDDLDNNYPKLSGTNHTDPNNPFNYTVYYMDNIELVPNAGFDITTAPGKYRLVFEAYDLDLEPYFNRQTYPIRYVNENLPYIQSVTHNGMPLSANPVITRIGQDILVEVGGSATDVSISAVMGSTTYEPASDDEITLAGGDKIANFKLDQLRPGIQTLYITVEDGDGNSQTQEFLVEAVLTPTIKLTGLKDTYETRNVGSLIAHYVNLTDPVERAKTEIFLNGGPITDISGEDCVDDACLEEDTFTITLNASAVIPGRNELRFRLTNNAVVSERTYVFYYIAKDLPMIEVAPVDSGGKFERVDLGNMFTTTEGEVFFSGVLANADTVVVKQNGDTISWYERSGNNWAIKDANYERITFDETSANTYNFRMDRALNLILTNADGTLNYSADNIFSFQVYRHGVDTTPTELFEITIRRNPAPYEMTEDTQNFFDKGVINRNYLPFTIDTDGALEVKVNKLPMKQIDHPVANSKRVRYHLDVPLTSGKNNKLNIELTYPGMTVKDTLEILSSSINQPGAAYMDEFGRRVDFKKIFNGDLELSFKKGTLLRQAVPFAGVTGALPQLYTDVPIFFGIAVPDTGLVIEENRGEIGMIHLMKSSLSTPSQYTRASDLYWIDAGLIEQGPTPEQPGAAVGGVAPFTPINGTYINFRHVRPDLKIEPTEAGTLTLRYDPNIVVAASQLLTVMYHDGYQWHNLGGVVDSKKGTITVPFNDFGYYTVMRLNRFFVDANQHDWARDDINIMKARGWMRELSPNMFGTSTFAQRGELATMLVKMLDIPLSYDGDLTFSDVPRNAADDYNRWDYRYIETAARKGIVMGLDGAFFNATGNITRQDAAVMIARAMDLKLSSNESAKAKMENKFLDGNTINIYAAASIEAVEKKGIMQGRPGPIDKTLNFAPQANLTRAELATIAVRVLRDMKRLEK